jgi:tripartite-type tricarboxylate transporter receptor subunit TctC
VSRLNAEIKKVVAIEDVRQRLIDSGSEIVAGTPAEADSHLKGEVAKWAMVVKAANVTAD